MEGVSKFFQLKEYGTDLKTEVSAGITTFMTMGYIFIVNPDMLSMPGVDMDRSSVFVATVLASIIATIMMALLARYPFALAPGMGLNAVFAFNIAMNYGWETALLAVFIEGIIFILLSLVNFREAIFNAIPTNLKHAVAIGLGLFIAFIGFSNAGIVVASEATKVTLGDVGNLTTMLSILGVFITVILIVKKVKGAILIGILVTYLIGVVCQILGIYVPNPDLNMFSLYPSDSNGNFAIFSIPTWNPEYNLIAAFSKGTFQSMPIFEFISILIALLFVDIFDTIGTLIGVSSKAGLLDEDGKLPRVKPALLSDAIGTTVGGLMGTSTVTTYVESASGVADGGRTGLTSIVVSILMFLTLFMYPVISAIPSFATAPALIVVGMYMFDAIRKVNLDSFEEVVPVFMMIVLMPLTYSIADGLMFGFLSYVVAKLAAGKIKEVNPIIIVISLTFVIAEMILPFFM